MAVQGRSQSENGARWRCILTTWAGNYWLHCSSSCYSSPCRPTTSPFDSPSWLQVGWPDLRWSRAISSQFSQTWIYPNWPNFIWLNFGHSPYNFIPKFFLQMLQKKAPPPSPPFSVMVTWLTKMYFSRMSAEYPVISSSVTVKYHCYAFLGFQHLVDIC